LLSLRDDHLRHISKDLQRDDHHENPLVTGAQKGLHKHPSSSNQQQNDKGDAPTEAESNRENNQINNEKKFNSQPQRGDWKRGLQGEDVEADGPALGFSPDLHGVVLERDKDERN